MSARRARGARCRELADGNAQLRQALDATMAERAALLGSTSWRLTAPLRGGRRPVPPGRGGTGSPQKT